MNQQDYMVLVGNLMHEYKERHPSYHCKLTNCCGICERFYPCLYYILSEIKNHTEKQQKEQNLL